MDAEFRISLLVNTQDIEMQTEIQTSDANIETDRKE